MIEWKVGDRVKIELRADGELPRWDCHSDYGGSGKYVLATITALIDGKDLWEVKFDVPIANSFSQFSTWLVDTRGLIPAKARLRLVDRGSHYATEEG